MEANDVYKSLNNLYAGRKIIIKACVIMVLIGVVYALLSPVYYKSSTTFLSNGSQDVSSTSGLQGLASLAGFNLDLGSSSEINPLNYGNIVGSMPFMLEILDEEIVFDKNEDPISVKEYYINKKPGVISFIKSYTIGLLGKIKGIFKGEVDGSELKINGSKDKLIVIDKRTEDIIQQVLGNISVFINEENGTITISCEMPTAISSAHLTRRVREKLQEYVTNLKIEKAKGNYLYVKSRYEEVNKEFNELQKELAVYKDQNKNIGLELYQIKEKELEREYDLVYSVLAELAKQKESSKLLLKESTPVFSVLQPEVVPLEKIRPQRALIVLMCAFLGFFLGFIIVFVRLYLKDFTKGFKDYNRQVD